MRSKLFFVLTFAFLLLPFYFPCFALLYFAKGSCPRIRPDARKIELGVPCRPKLLSLLHRKSPQDGFEGRFLNQLPNALCSGKHSSS
jgi:hypothetical protein